MADVIFRHMHHQLNVNFIRNPHILCMLLLLILNEIINIMYYYYYILIIT